MRVIVCQHGSRHRYMIPRLFNDAGVLEALYTDSCSQSPWGRFFTRYPWIFKNSQVITRLRNRITGLPDDKVLASDCRLIQEFLRRCLHRPVNYDKFWYSMLSEKMIKWGVGSADWVYNMYSENLDFLRYIKGNHPAVKIMIDVYINPLSDVIVKKAMDNYSKDIQELIKVKEPRFLDIHKEAFSLADILVCPSSFVASGVKELDSGFSSKIRIVPYGSSISYVAENIPTRGRFFFAGAEWFRKGLQYFAEAATILKAQYPDMDFRVAGITDPRVMQISAFKNLTFLGRLNTEEMRREFLAADAFVLPSLSEGMASVVIEAIAAGCPVVITRACGIDCIKDGVNGCIVEPNAESVANKLKMLYSNRDKRDSIASGAMKLVPQFSYDAWGQRLLDIFS